MIVDNLDAIGTALGPDKADAPAIIDATRTVFVTLMVTLPSTP
jgi:hypothetical protein